MCGIIGYVGRADGLVLNKLIYESGVRGLHHFGQKVDKKQRAGIYHCRYITSGETNQPLNVDNRWLAFNGVINMGTKEEMEAEYDLKLQTDNDGEVILRKATTPEDSLHFLLTHPRSTFAGLWLEPNRLVAMRNNGRPLWMVGFDRVRYFASTKDIFERVNIESPVLLEPFRIYEWIF